jgi:hypothetical protein
MNIKFGQYDCNLVFSTYQHYNNTSIHLVDSTNGAPIATATLNPEMVLPPNQVVIKDYSENEGMFQALFEAGIIGGPSHWYESGFIKAPVCDLLVDIFQEDEEEGFPEVSQVKWVVTTDEFKTFEFTTEKNVHIEESDMDYDLFRLFLWNQDHEEMGGHIEIMVANREDYDIHEDVTHLFDIDVIVAECLAVESSLSDMTAEYIQHYEERGEE